MIIYLNTNIVKSLNHCCVLKLPITTRCLQEKHIIHQLEIINGVISLFWINSYSRLLSKEI